MEFLIINATSYNNEKIKKIVENPCKLDKQKVIVITDNDNDAMVQYAYEQGLPVIGFGKEYSGRAKYVVWEYEDITSKLCELVYARTYGIPLTIFETQRLLVREMQEEDLKDLYSIYQDKTITEFVEPLYEYEEELKYTRGYIENMYGLYEYGLWLVYRKEDNKLIGRVGIENRDVDGHIEPELGYVIGKEFQRQGYAYECCKGVLDYAFNTIKMEAISLFTKENNLPSKMLATKLGFTLQLINVDKEGLDMYQVTAEKYNNM